MENPSFNLLKYRPFPELAQAVRQRSPHILERLQVAVKELLPSADPLTFVELRDQLPEALEQLAGALAASTPGHARSFLEDSTEHGHCRFHQSFNLRELLVEYSLLRTILIDEICAFLHRPLQMDEIATLNVGVDAASRRAVGAFVAQMARDIQATSEAESKHLSFLSHDLRGNLNGILLMLEVLRRELGSNTAMAESLKDLDMMRRTIQETVGTMERFLYAERFRKGKVEVKLAKVDLDALLHDVAGQCHPQALEKDTELVVDASQCPSVISDRELVLLIVQNLVANAVKYTPRGVIRLISRARADGGCQIIVADNGPGIAADQMEHLFDAFTRGDTHGQKGVGLGLTIARQAADLLSAKLWVESTPGNGAKFHLDFAFTMIAVVQRVSQASVEVDGSIVGQIGHGLLVLVAVHRTDTADDIAWTAKKLVGLRVFRNGDKYFDQDVTQIGGSILLVSNFTVAGDTRQGRRPSLIAAADPATGRRWFDELVQAMRGLGVPTETGVFGAEMRVSLVNDGPVTFLVDSRASQTAPGEAGD